MILGEFLKIFITAGYNLPKLISRKTTSFQKPILLYPLTQAATVTVRYRN